MPQFGDSRLPARFWDKVSPEPNTGCWLWTGCADPKGYGQVDAGCRRTARVHRFAYEMLVGPTPDGLQLDHLCRTPCCCNPAHLEPVTPGENVRRGDHRCRRKTHCPQGHQYDEANTYTHRGKRSCRTCWRAASARLWQRRKLRSLSRPSDS